VPVPLTAVMPPVDSPDRNGSPVVLSYFAQRRATGYIGLLLPPAVLVYDQLTVGCLPASISASYYTGIRDFLVGSLCAVAVFLICSVGYKKDKPWSIFAGVVALVVAFCPTEVDTACKAPGASPPSPFISIIHNTAGCALFLIFAYFCLVLFIRTRKNGVVNLKPKLAELPRPKRRRNIVYLLCGWIILLTVAGSGIWTVAAAYLNVATPQHLLFWAEWVCLWAFGFAWLVKGQQLFRDVEDQAPVVTQETFAQVKEAQ
jgi:hypothetical protein